MVLQGVVRAGGCLLRASPPWSAQAGWFLLAHARAAGDAALAARAVRVIDDNFAWGWDDAAPSPGGLLYFRDIEGFSPTQLEWNMCVGITGQDACRGRLNGPPASPVQEALVAAQRSNDWLRNGVPADGRRRSLGPLRKGACLRSLAHAHVPIVA